MINILGNAVKFTDAPGKVSFTIEELSEEDGICRMKFTMRDTGIGMDSEYLPKIFETFSQEDASNTNSYGGSGLGMAITRNLVEMMNGEIGVESKKGKGTVFTVVVPLTASSRTEDKATAEEKAADTEGVLAGKWFWWPKILNSRWRQEWMHICQSPSNRINYMKLWPV